MTTPMSQQMSVREAASMQIVYRYVAMSAGAALIPAPGVDTIVLAGIHVALIKEICEQYDVSFSEHAARNILIAVLASVGPGAVGSLASRKVLQVLSATTRVFGWAFLSAWSAAFSYGLGRLFITHFESGGTLLSFDATRVHRVFGK